MDRLSLSQFLWMMRLRGISACSLLLVLSVLLVGHLIPVPLHPYLALGFSVISAIWMLTAPLAMFPCVAGIRPSLRYLLARKRSLRTMPILVDIAEGMGASLPKAVKVVKSDKINAGMNAKTLFITEALEPFLWTRMGRAILAHELAHGRRRHTDILSLVLTAVLAISGLFGAQFWPLHNGIGFAMGFLAFLTLLSFALPVASRKMEYDADAIACESVGPKEMIGMLKAIVPFDSRDLETDSHPSIKARIQRLQSNRVLEPVLH